MCASPRGASRRASKSNPGREAVLAVLKTLPPPAADACAIPIPSVVGGTPKPPYREDAMAGEDGVGLSFDFEAQPSKGRYYTLKPKIQAISIPGIDPSFSDEQATRFLMTLVSKTQDHEEVHIRVAIRVALSVQQTPEFQALGSAGLVKVAKEIEGYVNSTADIKTEHGHALIREKVWEGARERQIQREIDRAIKQRIKKPDRFDKRLKRLTETSGRILEPETGVEPDVFKEDIYEE